MKKILFVMAAILLLETALFAQCPRCANSHSSKSSKSSKFRVDELIILPHPGRALRHGAKEIGITKEELQRISKEVRSVYPPIFQEKIRQAYNLERQVQRMVAQGKTKHDLKEKLDAIAKLKREAIDTRIDALNHFRKIIGDEKWQKVINFRRK